MEEAVVVYESGDPRACSDRALVLNSLGIPHEVAHADGRLLLLVPSAFAERAKHELREYDQENLPRRLPPRPVRLRYHDPLPGAIGYLLVLVVVGWLAGRSALGHDWFAAGRVDGAAVRGGEWWRVFTALTLHSGAGHLLGNIGFGVLFGGLAARLVGSGIAWLTVVLAAAAGNALNVLALAPAHRAVGASTAVFAALGLLAGFVWRGKLMAGLIAQDRWAFRLAPLVGGIALLAYTGTGDEGTDVGAHLAGFLCGLAGGVALTFADEGLENRRLQAAAGALAAALVLLAWLFALGAG